MMLDPTTIIRQISIALIPLIFAITLHEAAHGYVASKFGDTTALMLGRVSLNPTRHIDLFGTVILPIVMLIFGGFIFGWAKPVPVNWNNLRKPRRDMALVAIAGPAANLAMALLWAIVAKLSLMSPASGAPGWAISTLSFLQLTSFFGIKINIILMILNLLPIPPLDGSRIISCILPPAAAIAYEKIEPFGIWILLGLIFIGALQRILGPLVLGAIQLIIQLFNF